MRQDRRKNGWIVIGSIIEMILGTVLISLGIALGVTGFLYKEKLLEISDLQFFINQKGIIEAQKTLLNNRLLTTEFLYLAFAIILAVIGIISLVFAILSLVYTKKRKVVRRRIALILYTLIPLAIVGCAVTYYIFERDVLSDNITYALYGIIGAFGFVALCKILGVVFGRSEKFMSNDNSKYSFDNSAVRNLKANGNEVKPSVSQNGVVRPVQNTASQPKPMVARNNPGQMPPRPMQRPQNQPNMQRPAGQPQMRRPAPTQGQAPLRSSRPAPNGQMPPRPMPQRPANAPVRPVNAVQRSGFCPKCGKQLNPQEKFCTLCGYKVVK